MTQQPQVSASPLPPLRAGATAALLLACLPGAGVAATAVERGDVLRVDVLSAPEFSRQTVPVDADGRIALPALGTIDVAGRDIDRINAEIASAFAARDLLKDPVVLVEVVSYRQVYVGGTVGRPGAIDFVPGMTARQALVAAGGVRLVPTDAAAAPEKVLAAVAERRAKAFLLAQTVARIARLEAELADAPLRSDELALPGVAPAVGRSVSGSEAALLTEVNRKAEARQTHTRDLLALIDLELGTLVEQAALQQTEADLQQSEIDDARKLVERGLMPRTRLQDLLREQSQLSRDRLETSAFVARARQQAETVRFERADDAAQRRQELRLELQDAEAERVGLEAAMAALDIEITAGGLPSHGVVATRLVIHRTVAGTATRIEAELDDPVMPGDVLELSLTVPDGQDAESLLPAAVRLAVRP